MHWLGSVAGPPHWSLTVPQARAICGLEPLSSLCPLAGMEVGCRVGKKHTFIFRDVFYCCCFLDKSTLKLLLSETAQNTSSQA